LNQPRPPARICYSRRQSNERHDFQIRKPTEGGNWRDFAYREPGNLYVPSWKGTGWAPGSFTPAFSRSTISLDTDLRYDE